MRLRASRSLPAEVALLAVSLSAGIGALRLTRSPGSERVVLPVVVSVLAGHLVCALVQRALRVRLAGAIGAAAGTAAVVLVSIWTSAGSSTLRGLPTSRTFSELVVRFEQAGTVIRSRPTPLPATTGVVLCFVMGAGLVAVVGRALWGWVEPRAPGSARCTPALVPSFGLFVYSALLSSDVGRVPGAATYVACALSFLLCADRSRPAPAAGSRIPSRSARTAHGGLLGGLAGGTVALCALLALAPVLSGMKIDALPFSAAAAQGGGPGDGGRRGPGAGSGIHGSFDGIGPLDLINDLQAVITSHSNDLMFSARTEDPTYWQVASLTEFNGAQWAPDPATQLVAGELTGSPVAGTLPLLPGPSQQPQYTADVSLADYEGTLVPVPPTTDSVSGDGTRLDPQIGVIDTSSSHSGNGASYALSARVPPSGQTLAAEAGSSSGPATASPGALAPYLALPTIDPSVVALAHQIVAGQTAALGKATALARWFDSGQFRYTLYPPSVPGDTDPLYTFLFVTKAGFCQQFAGAYAVLARIDQLPTRVAIGFSTGTAVGQSPRASTVEAQVKQYRITGSDAHVWPEVYLGPQAGWVSFEPTPPASAQATPVGVVSGTGLALQPAITPTPSTVPATTLPAAGLAHQKVVHSRARPRSRPSSAWIALAVSLVALGGMWLAFKYRHKPLGSLRRRLRSRAPGAAGPDAEVRARLEDAVSSLRRAGMGRRSAETLGEHARRLRLAGWTAEACDAYDELSRLAERAIYACDPCSGEDARRAAGLCESLRAAAREERHRTGVLTASGRR